MTMLDIHSAALNSMIASHHEFLARFSKYAKVVYGFVEGKEDPCFYRGVIDSILPADWAVELWPAGNKKQVLEIYSALDWRKFPKKRICFFVDRDLSDIIPASVVSDMNIYTTSSYSIENDVVNRSTLERVLSELCGFANTAHDEIESVCKLFEEQLEMFLKSMIPIMAWILYWRRSEQKLSLDAIQMRHLFSIKKGNLHPNARPKGKESVVRYLHEQCNMPFEPDRDISPCGKVFKQKRIYRKFTRGKYVLWFFVEFCNSVHRDAAAFFSGITSPPKMHVTLSHANCVLLVAPRARVPVLLAKFVKSTFWSYIVTRETAAG